MSHHALSGFSMSSPNIISKMRNIIVYMTVPQYVVYFHIRFIDILDLGLLT